MNLRLLLNAGSNSIPTVVKTCIAFFISPIIVHSLGNYDYGIWEIVFSIIGYLGILDLGLQPAIVRYVARYTALQQNEDLQKIYSTSLFCLGGVGIVLCLVMWGSAALWPSFLSPPDGERGRYTWFLIIVGVQLFLIFPGSVFDCFLQGLQRYSVRSTVNVINLMVGALVVAYFLLRGHGLITLAIVDVVGRFSKFAVFAWWLSRPANGGYRFHRKYMSRATLTEMFGFGVKNLVYAISVRMATATDPLVIGAFIGAAAVPFYVIPANLIGYGKSLIWQATDVLMPFFSQMDANGDRDAVRKAYYKTARYSIGAIVPLIVGITILGPNFISLWMGPEYADRGTRVLYLLTAACGVTFINSNCSRFLIGSNRHNILAKVGLISAILNVALSIVLVQVIGIEGVAAGTLISYSLAEPYLLFVVCRVLDMSVWSYARNAMLPVIPAALFQTVLLYEWKKYFVILSYQDIVIAATCSVLIYIPSFFLIAFDQNDRKWFQRQVSQAIIPWTRW